MIMSQAEFSALLKKNPQLKVHVDEALTVEKTETVKNPKYWNVPVYIYEDGTVSELKTEEMHGKIVESFDSRREYIRYLNLTLLQKAGKISDLTRQTTLEIAPKTVYRGEIIRAITYRADFTYMQNGEYVVEDVKGYDTKTGKHRSTAEFKLKWKLLKGKYPQWRFEIF